MRTFLRSAFLLVLVPVVHAQDDQVRRIDAMVRAARDAWNVPGLSVAVVRNDSAILVRGYGVKEMNTNDPVDGQTLFAIASNTKAFTASLLAGLVDEGRLSWNDRVQTILPYFTLYDPYVSSDVRIRDLLSHRVGLGTYSGDLVWYGTSYSREEVVRKARFLPQAFPFRGGYGYSNIMYVAAGEVITKVTGQSWESLLQSRILDPLGMTGTVTSVRDVRGHPNAATPHGETDGTLRSFPWYDWDAMVPAGGIISSAADMSRWLRMVIRRGTYEGGSVYSDAQSRILWTPHASFVVSQRTREQNPSMNFSGYGLGWSLQDYRGRLMASHGGGYDGMFSRTVVLPDAGIGVVVLTNSMTGLPGALTNAIVDLLLGVEDTDWLGDGLRRARETRTRDAAERARRDSARVRGTRPSLSVAAYAGTYGGPMYGDATVAVENGRLVLRLLPNPDLVGDLTHWHYDVFQVTWRQAFPWFGRGLVQFVMSDDGRVAEMKMNVPNEDFWFEELEFRRRP